MKTILNPTKRLHSIHFKKCNKETIFDVGGQKTGNTLRCPKCYSILAQINNTPFILMDESGIITKSRFNK